MSEYVNHKHGLIIGSDNVFFNCHSDAMKIVREVDRRLAGLVMPKKK